MFSAQRLIDQFDEAKRKKPILIEATKQSELNWLFPPSGVSDSIENIEKLKVQYQKLLTQFYIHVAFF